MHETLPDFLDSISEKYSLRTALQMRRVFRTDRYTYGDLSILAQKTASYFQAQGIKKGDCILIWAPNMPEWIICWFGILTLGAIAVPVGLHSSAQLIEKYISQTGPKIIFCSKFFPIDFNNEKHREIRIIYLEDLVPIVRNLQVKKLPKIEPKLLAELVFTSGTTGEPKGVMISHRNILFETAEVLKFIPEEKNYRLLSILPLSHVMEQILGVFVPLSLGATIYYMPRINMVLISTALRKYKITHLGVVPQMLRLFYDNIEYQAKKENKLEKLNFMLKIAPNFLPICLRRVAFRQIHKSIGGNLRYFGSGSAPLDLKLAWTWEAMGIRVVEGYGLSETTAAVTANRPERRKLGSVGKKLGGVEIKLSAEGEILVKGDNVTSGYYQNERKTKESFTKDHFFKTGDIGYFDSEGYLFISGREKFKIVTASGDKVYPEDIEKKLNSHKGVWESCAFGVKKGDGEVVCASLILKNDFRGKVADIINEVNPTLEPKEYIQDFSVWKEKDFPRLHTLKIDRELVKKAVEAGFFQNGETVPKTEENGDVLKEILGRICKVSNSKIKEQSTLVGLGLDSLKRVELVSLIEQEYNAEIDEAAIGAKTTVSDLRKLIGDKKSTVFSYNLDEIYDLLTERRNQIFKGLAQLLAFGVFKFFVHLTTVSKNDWQKMDKPSVFVGNHPGPLDVVCLLQALPRKLREKILIVTDDTTWKDKKLGIQQKYYSLVSGCFPFDKDGPITKSLNMILDFLDCGNSVILLPEGQFTPKGKKLAPLKKGLSVLFTNTEIPLIPYYISGNFNKTFPQGPGIKYFIPKGFSKPTIKIGEPFTLTDLSQDEAMDLTRQKILELSQ